MVMWWVLSLGPPVASDGGDRRLTVVEILTDKAMGSAGGRRPSRPATVWVLIAFGVLLPTVPVPGAVPVQLGAFPALFAVAEARALVDPTKRRLLTRVALAVLVYDIVRWIVVWVAGPVRIGVVPVW
jgi:hypothetical protein